MRRYWVIIPGLFVAALILAVTALAAPTASADNAPAHVKGWGATPDQCAACHRIHRGQNGTYNLVAEVQEICRTCHGASASGSVLDVFDGTNDSDTGALRSGGFETARIKTTDPSLPVPLYPSGLSGAAADAARDVPGPVCYQDGIDNDGDGVIDDGCKPLIGVLPVGSAETTQSKHSTDGSAQTIWGNGAIGSGAGMTGYALECGSCHDPHGNGNYRILRTIPTGSGGAGYAIPDTYPKTQASYSVGLNNYFNMAFPGQIPGDSYVTSNILIDTSAWCAQCHTRYLATRYAPTGAVDSSRVNSGDPIFTFRHTSSGKSYTSGGAGPTPVDRACITCHAAHGTNGTAGDYSGSVPRPGVTPVAPPPAGTNIANSNLLKMNNRGMCQKCHNK